MGINRKGTFRLGNRETSDVSLIDSAEKLLEFARTNGISISPINLEAIAEKLGIDVVLVSNFDDDISGTLEKGEDGRWIIQVNASHHPNRQRYTIAHELGHYCLHRHQESSFEDQVFFRGLERTRTETQANRFASELLMPESLFSQFLDEGVTSIEQLSQKFGVSTLALRIRAQDLGYSESET